MNKYEDYHKTRFSYNKERDKIWKEICIYLQKFIKKDSSVLDLGSGYCEFINNINASKKFALDKYLDPKNHANKDVISLFGDQELLNKKIEDSSIDVVFASNFFEHINEEDLERYFRVIYKKLKKGGRLILVQPNFRLCYKTYFDDYTHVKIWTDQSLKDYMVKKGYKIVKIMPRFLPFSMKSRLPKNSLLVRTYLNSPIKPYAGQMLLVGEK